MKKITELLLIATLFLINSCITRQVKKDPSYQETFRGYFISQRDNDIVFIGKKYHYIFKDNAGQIAEFTKPEWKGKLKISNIQLRVNEGNNVYGNVTLEFIKLEKNLSWQEDLMLKGQEFIKNNRNIYSKQISLKGIRYEPAIGFNNKFKEYFSRDYESKIFYDVGAFGKVKKATLTPVAYASDGLLILVGGVWIPLIIIALTDENTPEKFMRKIKGQ